MMIRLIYASTAAGPVTTAVTGTILRSAQAHNTASGITGVLCQGQGVYLQVLEGGASEVEALYARIVLDKRHQNISLRKREDIAARRYGNWAMAHVDLNQVSRTTNATVPSPPFDPYTATADQLMATLDRLMTSGTVMTSPVV